MESNPISLTARVLVKMLERTQPAVSIMKELKDERAIACAIEWIDYRCPL